MTDSINKNDENQLKPKNMCGVCEALGKAPPCLGHGSSGGGSSGGGGGEETSNAEGTGMENISPQMNNEFGVNRKIINENDGGDLQQSSLTSINNKEFNIETVGLLTIYYDNKNGNIIIRGKDELSEIEKIALRQLLIAVKNEFAEFKNNLEMSGISVEKFHINFKDNELSICIPNLKYYNAFIKLLHSKNLLPEDNIKQENKNSFINDDKNQTFKEKHSTLSPFQTKPKPK